MSRDEHKYTRYTRYDVVAYRLIGPYGGPERSVNDIKCVLQLLVTIGAATFITI